MSLRIIALIGLKGSGKDTVARMIVDQFDNVQTVAFADPIKKVINDLFELDPSNNDQYDAFKRTHVSYQLPGYFNHVVFGRNFVREIGMLMRSYDDNQFNQYVLDRMQNEPESIWVVTDVRFDNEFDMLSSLGAKMIRINHPDCQYDGHVSERGFDVTVDFELSNDGSLADLNTQTGIIMNKIMKEWA